MGALLNKKGTKKLKWCAKKVSELLLLTLFLISFTFATFLFLKRRVLIVGSRNSNNKTSWLLCFCFFLAC